MERLARLLRRRPWLMVVARRIWQWTRPRVTMGVVGVVMNASGQILMVEHVFHPYTPWGLPGGWVERREDPRDTLQREMQEELSLAIEVGPVLAVETVERGHLDLAYLCIPRGEVGALSFELLNYRWCDPADLPHTHAFHRRAIQAAQRYANLAIQDRA